ncbi:carboxypeptidase-like regulatory domain-containing protein [Dysgonomonas sp. 520]|uniref:carboxypeptidase-like regulatory domain-containing protein n=1 Tax=Dysgonomonas sp. 520 TaxID=2302931 RepID=UPI0013D2A1EF|nr:carboxypeptidase-like regulatory domain-containing protein [Dysgonomonas sp. 520]NDW09763.1 VWA domain-containing protein [Dysgonomonas sp. 520]
MRKATLLFISLMLSLLAFSQTTRIKGSVKDKYGDELIGVSVTLKGTTTGTCTDIDGNFTLDVPSTFTGRTVVFSYIGYKSKELPIQPKMDIVLDEEEMTLDEVVVVGYGVQQKRSVMGSVSSISVQEMRKKGKDKATTWKRSGITDNSIRLQVGDDDFIPLESVQMAVQVDGFRVRVLMDCFFFNDKKDNLEGVFKLKLPTGATPFCFAFGETEYNEETDANNNIMSKKVQFTKYDFDDFELSFRDVEDSSRDWERVKAARIVSKQKAAKAYEDILSANIDPALMEWGGADMFSCRVFPMANNTLHQIVIGYDVDMTEALDFREHILSIPKAEKDVRLDMHVYNSPSMPVDVSPNLKETTHNADGDLIENDGTRKYYSVTNPQEKEITISYNTTAPVVLIQDSSVDSGDNNDYFASAYRVELPEEVQDNLPKDAVFLLDVSLSSNPDKFNVWLKLIEEILEKNRDIIKRFAVLSFNIENRWYSKFYESNNYYNVQKFLEYANTLSLEGATDIYTALKEGASPSWLKKNASKHIFLMSDADCNWGETNKHTFKYLVNKGDRIHTYKTGLSGTNMGVLDFLSRETGGYSFTVTGEEEAELTAKSFRYKPWKVEDIKVEGVKDFLISGNPTQLYNGQKLLFTGRGEPTGKILIKVNNGTQRKEIAFDAAEKIESPLASRVYGQIAMSYLDNYGYKAEDAAINYSTYYQIPGQYTSFLMLDRSFEYEDYGAIDMDDAENFVDDNEIHTIIAKLEEQEAALSLGNSKADFLAWMKGLSNENSVIDFRPKDEFTEYVNGLPEEIFKVWLKPLQYYVYLSDQQDSDEKEILNSDDIRFDRMYKLSKNRKKTYGKADALKLLSSVVEKNASDVQAVRDIAMVVTDWGMGDQAYYMMRRIIEWRQGEAISYLTAADALANTINNIDMALIYYYICLNSDWDSDYGSFEEVAALRCYKYMNKLLANKNVTISPHTRKFLNKFKAEVEKILDDEDLLFEEADLVIMVNWNIDNTDIDLHVLEPTGEECYYAHSKTEIGGRLSIDVTDGYGPEMYILKKAPEGDYKVMLKYYSGNRTKTASKAKAYIDVYQDWGRKNEKVTRKTVLLENVWDKETVMQFRMKDKR